MRTPGACAPVMLPPGESDELPLNKTRVAVAALLEMLEVWVAAALLRVCDVLPVLSVARWMAAIKMASRLEIFSFTRYWASMATVPASRAVPS